MSLFAKHIEECFSSLLISLWPGYVKSICIDGVLTELVSFDYIEFHINELMNDHC